MPASDQEEQREQGQAQAAAAPEQAQDQAPAADASAVGNAAMEGRSGRSDALPPAPDAALAAQGPATPSTGAAVNEALVAVPFSGPTLVTTIAQWVRNAPGAGANLGRDVWIDALAGVLTGNEMAQVLHIIRFPAAGAGRVVHWLGAICKAHAAVAAASSSTYTNVLMGANQGDIAQLLQVGNDALLTNLLANVPSDPLTLFPATQAGLTAEAAASARFVAEMVARASDAQIWRAVKGTAPAALPALAANLNAAASGWGWLARLESASFSAADRVLLNALHPTANADGQAKITAANAVVGVETPTVPFATAFDTLMAAGVAPTAQALRTFMQTGSPAERVTVMTDAAKAAWVFGILTGHPFLELSVDASTRGDFLAVPAVFTAFWNAPMQWRETLEAVSDRAYLSRIAPNITAIGTAVATWIAGVPAADALTVPDELDLRAIGLATGHAGIGAAIVAKFGDTNYDGSETQSSAPAPAAAHDSPLTRLDGLLAQPVPSASEVLSMVGALGGSAERTTLIGDAARMTRIQNSLDDERFYQAIVVLRLSLTAGLTLLRQKGQSSARVQSLFDSATALDRNMAVRDDANVTMVSTVLPDAPLQLFFRGSLDAATLAYTAWRTWVLDVTPVSILLPLLGGNPTRARAAAQQLDAANAWGFLARVPSGPALSGPEKDALTNLLAATGLPAAAATLRAKTTATTEPAAPALVVPPAPVVPAPEVPAPEAPAPQGPEVVAAEPTKRQLFEDEVQSATANATRLSQLAGELSQPDRDAVAATHRAAIIALLGGADLARFVATLSADLSQKLEWLRAKGGGIPNSEMQAIIARAPLPECIAVFDNVDLISLIAGANLMGPFQTIPALSTELATLAAKPFFWWWVGQRCTSLDILKYVATSGSIPASIGHLTAMGFATPFASLPRGTGLSGDARGHLDAIMAALTTELALARDIFGIRFNVALSGAWAAAAIDDISRMYIECQGIPIAHVANNPKLQVFNRGTGGGGTYDEGNAQVNINQDDPNENATMYTGAGQVPVTERYFDHTLRHEIGHSVDALLGSRTSLVFGQAGWKEYGTSQLEQWIQLFDGWNPNGGVAPSDPEKQQIRDIIMQLMHSGGGAIDGPGGSISDIAPADHPWKTHSHLKIVDALDAHGGTMTYMDRLSASGKVFSINYYYRRFMECSAVAGASAPRDYAMFSPAEWFADMYAEYYRNFNGIDDSTLGGACPGWVKSWFLSNVHTVGGRTPHTLHGRAVPPGQRAHH